MTHQLIEIWSPKPAWLELPPDARKAFLDRVLASVAPLMATGLVPIGSGIARDGLPNPAAYRYFAVWEAPDARSITAFAEVIRTAGWFDYFDQLNIAGENVPLDDVLARHITEGA